MLPTGDVVRLSLGSIKALPGHVTMYIARRMARKLSCHCEYWVTFHSTEEKWIIILLCPF